MVQALAGLAGGKSFETLLFFGDENQRLEDFNHNPDNTRVPWVSAGEGDPHEPTLSEIEEQDGDPVVPIRTMPNARRRPLQEWLANAPTAKLTHCKRCGRTVCEYVERLMPFARYFQAGEPAADGTWLWRIFCDGRYWETHDGTNKKAGTGATGLAQSSSSPHQRPV